MNDRDIKILNKQEIPFLLKQIPEPPKRLYLKGILPEDNTKVLCIVGARRHSSYGEEVTKKLILGLEGYNICIVSGLAIGIDEIAHRAAMDAKLQTIAFPGSGLNEDILYPVQNKKLANEILYTGGALISEYKMEQSAKPWMFPIRNRLMAGFSNATIVIEAELISGTLITSRLATDYNRDVGAVPGQITSILAKGPNMLIQKGALPIICSEDILEMLGFERPDSKNKFKQKDLLLNLKLNEIKIIELLQIESMTNEQLIIRTKLNAREINENISSLEILELIREKNGKFEIN